MKCTLNINIEFLVHEWSIPYKYVIFSPNRKDIEDYEFIHDPRRKDGVVDRSLVVPFQQCKPKSKCVFCIILIKYMFLSA